MLIQFNWCWLGWKFWIEIEDFVVVLYRFFFRSSSGFFSKEMYSIKNSKASFCTAKREIMNLCVLTCFWGFKAEFYCLGCIQDHSLDVPMISFDVWLFAKFPFAGFGGMLLTLFDAFFRTSKMKNCLVEIRRNDLES